MSGHFLSDLFFSAILSIMPPINKAGIAQIPIIGKRKKKKNIKTGSSSSNISTSVFGVSVSIIAYLFGFVKRCGHFLSDSLDTPFFLC